MDGPRAYYAEWNKSEKKKTILYIDAYIWNLEGWYWWVCLQSSSGETDIENRLMGKGRGEDGEGEINEESLEAYTLTYVSRQSMGIYRMTQRTQNWGSVIT